MTEWSQSPSSLLYQKRYSYLWKEHGNEIKVWELETELIMGTESSEHQSSFTINEKCIFLYLKNLLTIFP